MQTRLILGITLALTFGLVPDGRAAGPETFQHTGRGTAQVGALTARALDASAMTYNPAGIVRLPGWNFLIGADSMSYEPDFTSSGETFESVGDSLEAPTFYLTWRPKKGRFAFGLGIDRPFNYQAQWDEQTFPGRFRSQRNELRVTEIHAALAFAINDHWSLGGGVRALTSTYEHANNQPGTLIIISQDSRRIIPFEIGTTAETEPDAITFDFGIQRTADRWGWGVVYRHGADFDDEGTLQSRVVSTTDPSENDRLLRFFDTVPINMTFDLPSEVRTGFWFSPMADLQLELDLSWQSWSDLEATDITLLDSGSVFRRDLIQFRDWDDTLSVRLGAEWKVAPSWLLSGGLAHEPSPVPVETLDPAFPISDALVYAAGISYQRPSFAVDIGVSFHDFDGQTTRRLLPPTGPIVSAGVVSGEQRLAAITLRWQV